MLDSKMSGEFGEECLETSRKVVLRRMRQSIEVQTCR
jgi:hypothetical protein